MLSFKNTTLFSEIGIYFKENDSSEAVFTLLRFLRSFNLPLDVLNLRDKPNTQFNRAQTLMTLSACALTSSRTALVSASGGSAVFLASGMASYFLAAAPNFN